MHQLHIRKLLNLKLKLTFLRECFLFDYIRLKSCSNCIYIHHCRFVYFCLPCKLIISSKEKQKNRPRKNEKEARGQLALIDVDWMFRYCWQRFTKIFRLSLQVAVSVLHRSSSCLQQNNEVNTRAKVLRQQHFCYFSLTMMIIRKTNNK